MDWKPRKEPSCRQPLARMSEDRMSKSPQRKQANSPKGQQDRRSPSRPEVSEDEEPELTDDNDGDSNENENDRTDESRFPSSPETSSPTNVRNAPTYKSTSFTHTETIETSSKYQPHSLRLEKESTIVQRKKVLEKKWRKDTKKESNTLSTKSHYITKCLWCLLVPFGILAWNLLENQAESAATMPPQEDRFKLFVNDLLAIKNKFPDQSGRSWLDIRGGVSDVMHSSGKPWTIVLFSNETTTISCLAKLLGDVTSKALKSDSSLVLRPEDMGNEYGDTIYRLRPLILKRKAVVVHDLLNIDPGAIQAFHSMCDRETPLVKEAVYIITIIAPGYTSSQRPELFIENVLTQTFMNKVDLDKLQPLITRLTDGPIIPVAPGNVPAKCTM